MHHAVVVIAIGILEPVGVLLNLFSLVVFCYDKLNRGSALVLLQTLCVMESLYLIFNFFGTFLPGLVYYKTSEYQVTSSCVPKGNVDIYASGRVTHNRMFSLLLDTADSGVVWMTLLICIYSLFPLCCFKVSKKRIFNQNYGIVDTVLTIAVVLIINIFTYVCGPNPLKPDERSCSGVALIFDNLIRNQLQYLLPALATIILYMSLSVQLYILKGTSMDPRETNLMTQLLRAYAVSSMFLLCEVITFIWLIQGGNIVLKYLILLSKHINCSFKFVLYCFVGQEFRTIVRSIFTKRMDDLEFHWEQQEMRPVMGVPRKKLHADPDGPSLPQYEEVCAVTHQVTVV